MKRIPVLTTMLALAVVVALQAGVSHGQTYQYIIQNVRTVLPL